VALLDRAIVRLLPAVPRPVVRRISSRYIAGTRLEDATRVVAELNRAGKLATIDVLGEEVRSRKEADEIVRAYTEVLEAVESRGLDSNVSVKPTALGLEIGYRICRDNLRTLVDAAAARGNFVRIDMEDSSTTDDTLRLYRELREAGRDNVGFVLQASLRRTLRDVRALADLTPNVRICKGIYVEPESLQFRDADAVRANFVRVLEALFEGGCYVGIATHDEWLLAESKQLVAEHGLGSEGYELQMLLGVRPGVADALVAEGHRLRVYVPFGSHWYEYSLRRLQENPSVAGYIAADTINRFMPRRDGA
jgi:proline dehydrogenase